MVSHHHEGFWLDVSTLRNFFDINLQLASRAAPLSIEEIHKGIVSRGASSAAPPCALFALHKLSANNARRGVAFRGWGAGAADVQLSLAAHVPATLRVPMGNSSHPRGCALSPSPALPIYQTGTWPSPWSGHVIQRMFCLVGVMPV